MNHKALFSLLTTVFMLTACATDTIEGRRSGQLIVCHKGDKTLTVSNADSFLHLDHGDMLGPCPEEPEEPEEPQDG